jgi:hypothetical protein
VKAGWGLVGSYYANLTWSGPPALTRQDRLADLDWRAGVAAVSPPFSAEWRGALLAPDFGPYLLAVQSPGSLSLYVDGTLVAQSPGGSAQASLDLAKGAHSLSLRCVVPSAGGLVSLSWTPPGGRSQPVPESAVRADPAINGLLATYFANDQWAGTPKYSQLVPLLAYQNWGEVAPRPSTVDWHGWLRAPTGGVYSLTLETDDRASLELDGRLLLDYNGASFQTLNAAASLAEGLHELRVRYYERRDFFWLRLFWTPPDGARELVPSAVLSPFRDQPVR